MTSKRRMSRLRRLLPAQGGLCPLCGGPVDLTRVGPWRPTLDHIVPLSKGGDNAMSNLQVAHWVCNNRRGDAMPDAMKEAKR
jgi:5-methylcytosine-specific restriction endonuclease McrA